MEEILLTNNNPTVMVDASASVMAHKSVQELAIKGCKELPVRYIRRDDEYAGRESPTTRIDSSVKSTEIPIIDMERLSSSSPEVKQAEMQKLRSALGSWGLFQAVGHGIPNSLLDELRGTAKQFFELPTEKKQIYSSPGTVNDLEGYGNDPVASDNQVLNWNDRLYLLVKPLKQRQLDRWPENPSRFRDVLHEYSVKSTFVAENILRSMAELVSLEETYFITQLGEQAPAYARFNHYPPCSRPDLVYGMTPHTDAGVITIVLQDDEVEGLQVFKDGKWIEVPTIPYAMLINVGDAMEIMSNGEFKSPVHRVITNAERERASLAMFFSPEFEKEIEPAAGIIDVTRPRLFRKVKFSDYLEYFISRFLQGKRAIDWAKV